MFPIRLNSNASKEFIRDHCPKYWHAFQQYCNNHHIILTSFYVNIRADLTAKCSILLSEDSGSGINSGPFIQWNVSDRDTTVVITEDEMQRQLAAHIYSLAEREFETQEELRKQAAIEKIANKLTKAFQKEMKNA